MFNRQPCLAICVVVLTLSSVAYAQLSSELNADQFAPSQPNWVDALSFESTYIGELFTNARGGINTSRATDYRGYLGISAALDLDAMHWSPGGTLMMLGEYGHGRGISDRHVGDFQLLSNIDGDQFVQISELWWQGPIGDSGFSMKIGRQDANADFAALQSTTGFVHSSFGLPPTVPMPTYPDPGTGVAAFFDSEGPWSFGLGVYEGSPNGGRLGLTRLLDAGAFVIAQANLRGVVDERRSIPTSLHVGYWYHSPDARGIGPLSTTFFSGNHGGYLGAEHQLVQLDPTGQSIIAFAQYGWAPSDRNRLNRYFGTGLVWQHPFARLDDSIGLGIANGRFSPHLIGVANETSIEVHYRLQLTPNAAIQPDFQYILQPSGVQRNSIVAGLRFFITF